jgi:hypothetical protein
MIPCVLTKTIYTGLEKRTLKGKVMANGARLIRRANPNIRRKDKRSAMEYLNDHLANILHMNFLQLESIPPGKVELKTIKKSTQNPYKANQ